MLPKYMYVCTLSTLCSKYFKNCPCHAYAIVLKLECTCILFDLQISKPTSCIVYFHFKTGEIMELFVKRIQIRIVSSIIIILTTVLIGQDHVLVTFT